MPSTNQSTTDRQPGNIMSRLSQSFWKIRFFKWKIDGTMWENYT